MVLNHLLRSTSFFIDNCKRWVHAIYAERLQQQDLQWKKFPWAKQCFTFFKLCLEIDVIFALSLFWNWFTEETYFDLSQMFFHLSWCGWQASCMYWVSA